MFQMLSFLLDKKIKSLYETENSYSIATDENFIYLRINTFGKVKSISFKEMLLKDEIGRVFRTVEKKDIKLLQYKNSVFLKISHCLPYQKFSVGVDSIKLEKCVITFDTFQAVFTDSFK